MESRKSTHHIVVPCYMTDRFNRLTPSAFMDMAQDVAGDNSNRLGFGYRDLMVERLVWIVSRMSFRILKTPLWEDELDVTSWHKGSEDGLFYRREFVVTSSKTGETLIQGSSGWLLLNIDTRQLVRTSPICNRPETICQENALEEPSKRLRMPRGASPEHVFDYVVRSGDIDRNFHANNAKYAVWAMEALPEEYIPKEVKEFSVNFNREIKEGETVSLFRQKLDEGHFLIEGRTDGLQSFIVEIKF